MPTKKRPTATTHTGVGKCGTCGASWSGRGAQGSAAHHHDETGHTTTVTVTMVVTYGRPVAATPAPAPGQRRQRERKWKA